MNRDMERYKEFSRRTVLIAAGQLGLFGILAGRLGYLQIIERDRFQTLSDKNRISLRLIPAARGDIMDRFGVPLAISIQNYRAFVVPEQTAGALEETLDRLSQIIPVSDQEKQEVLIEATRQRQFTPLLVKENLTWDDMARIEIRIPDLPGVSVGEGQTRSYPLGMATAHIIGYVGRVNQAELTDDPVLSIPGFRIGKQGIEKEFEEVLRGQAGQVRAEVNVVGREIRELERKDAQQGKRLSLTLDADLQMQCQNIIAEHKSASAVIMDAHTGEVYALCSHPSFDPNVFSQGIPADLWEELLSDDAHPLVNKATAGQYPPGSTFKMITALAGLEAGISPSHKVFCPGFYKLGRDKFHCWKHGGHGWVDVEKALEQSCDTFFYETSRKIGVDNIAKMARRFGLGEKTGIEIPGEGGGLIPDQAWKRRRYKKSWHQGETLNASIGQGYALTTPLQLAVMIARLVNGGHAVPPTLVRRKDRPEKWPDIKIPPAHLKIINEGMRRVVNSEKGTAYGSRLKGAGMSMGGKTGTAQVRRITAAQRAAGVKNEDLPWKQRHHALFTGYGPVENPKYVVSVVVEHGVGGSSAAAPLAKALLAETLKRDPRQIRAVPLADDPVVDNSKPKPKPVGEKQ